MKKSKLASALAVLMALGMALSACSKSSKESTRTNHKVDSTKEETEETDEEETKKTKKTKATTEETTEEPTTEATTEETTTEETTTEETTTEATTKEITTAETTMPADDNASFYETVRIRCAVTNEWKHAAGNDGVTHYFYIDQSSAAQFMMVTGMKDALQPALAADLTASDFEGFEASVLEGFFSTASFTSHTITSDERYETDDFWIASIEYDGVYEGINASGDEVKTYMDIHLDRKTGDVYMIVLMTLKSNSADVQEGIVAKYRQTVDSITKIS